MIFVTVDYTVPVNLDLTFILLIQNKSYYSHRWGSDMPESVYHAAIFYQSILQQKIFEAMQFTIYDAKWIKHE